MVDLRFAIDRWIGGGHGPTEDTATRGLLRIEADGVCLTRNDDLWSRSISETVHVSMYPLATWLAWNWWRLSHEPPLLAPSLDFDWRSAHELPAAGQGYLWPRLSIHSDGESVTLESTASPLNSKEPVRYVAQTSVLVTVAEFKRAIKQFVDTVVARLGIMEMPDARLCNLWQEIAEEQASPDLARRRRYEALLRCDPGEVDVGALEALTSLEGESGPNAAAELAAALPASSVQQTLQELRAATMNGSGVKCDLSRVANETTLARCRAIGADRARAPWERGYDAARQLRSAWKLGKSPLSTPAMESQLDMKANTLLVSSEPNGLPAGLAVEQGDSVRLLLRSRPDRSRRFEAARLLGDLVGAPADDRWHPATELRTARQKYQRAFAAEFLCPVAGLKVQLGDDRSEDAISAAAESFEVSEYAVRHQIENHLDRLGSR